MIKDNKNNTSSLWTAPNKNITKITAALCTQMTKCIFQYKRYAICVQINPQCMFNLSCQPAYFPGLVLDGGLLLHPSALCEKPSGQKAKRYPLKT